MPDIFRKSAVGALVCRENSNDRDDARVYVAAGSSQSGYLVLLLRFEFE